MASVQLSVGSVTDVGLRRRINEDSMLAGHPVYAVADGMGGHDAGDRASRAVVDALRHLVGRADLRPEHVIDAIATAHERVRDVAKGLERGAGSTVTGVVAIEHGGHPHWLVFNIGDSRVYRLRGSELVQLTVDHSVVQQLVDDGSLAREAVSSYSGRNVITRAVGSDESDADVWLYPLVTGDRLVLCSDGLTGEISDESIRAVLLSTHPVQEAADRLVSRAIAHGGRDNVTAIVVAVDLGGTEPGPLLPYRGESAIVEIDLVEATETVPSRRRDVRRG